MGQDVGQVKPSQLQAALQQAGLTNPNTASPAQSSTANVATSPFTSTPSRAGQQLRDSLLNLDYSLSKLGQGEPDVGRLQQPLDGFGAFEIPRGFGATY